MTINFTRAFDSAWERMVVILFQPMDPAKWFVIGFNAFLAILIEGSAAVNRPVSFQPTTQPQGFFFLGRSMPALLHAAKEWVSSAGGLLTEEWSIFSIIFAAVSVIVWVVGNWIGSRGQFLLLDNIVRNRAAISAPWQRYAWQGNIWFLVQIVLTLSWFIFLALSCGAWIALNWSWIKAERDPTGGETAVTALSLLVFLVLWLLYCGVIFLVRSFAAPLYFKQTLGLRQSLLAVARLPAAHPGSILCYLLINLVLIFATALLAMAIFCAVSCVVCWLAFIPFIGQMMMSFILCQLYLPLLIFNRCFQLDCLAQFGPEYDVWTVDVVPPPVGLNVPFNPQRPPG